MLIVDLNSKSAKKNGKDIIVNGIPQNGYEIRQEDSGQSGAFGERGCGTEAHGSTRSALSWDGGEE